VRAIDLMFSMAFNGDVLLLNSLPDFFSWYRTDFIGLTNTALPQLSEALHNAMEDVEKSMKQNAATKNAIPKLVYSMEQADNRIMKLSKLSGVNLVRNAKRSQNRSFRLKLQAKEPDENEHTGSRSNEKRKSGGLDAQNTKRSKSSKSQVGANNVKSYNEDADNVCGVNVPEDEAEKALLDVAIANDDENDENDVNVDESRGDEDDETASEEDE